MTPAARLLAAGALALAAASCGPDAILSYEDLVAAGRLGTFSGAGAGGEATCADETRFAVALEPGVAIDLQAELGEDPSVGLAACLEAPAGAEPGSGLLELEVRGTDGLATRVELPVDGGAWASRTAELAAHAEGRVELRLRVEAAAGSRLLLSDLFLRHRVPPADPAEAAPGTAERGAPPDGPSVLLISLDTLRADAVGSGTPALAAFARRAETWAPHFAAASWTKPSHASLLTGYPVEVHGAQSETQTIDPAVPTLAGRFQSHGYRTAGLVYDCEWVDAKWGFDRGFDEYRVMHWAPDQAARATVDWIGRHADRPFFYFLHLYAPHSDHVVLPYEGTGVDRGTVEERFGLGDYGCRDGSCASQLLLRINQGLEPLPEEERVLRYLYSRGVATTDAALGRLFQDLDESGLLDGLLVVVTSDHGEAFFEHGKVLHDTVHREVLEVPLLVHWPDGRSAGERRSVPSSSIDVAPTLLAAAGLGTAGLPGTPLDERDPREPVFSGTRFKSILVGQVHALFDSRTGEGELYHLGRDPREQHDLAASHPEEHLRLRERILARLEEDRRLLASLRDGVEGDGPPEVELTDEERRRLEALGYLD